MQTFPEWEYEGIFQKRNANLLWTSENWNSHEFKKLNLNHGDVKTLTLQSQCGSEYSQEAANMHIQSAFEYFFYQNLWGLLQDSYYICELFSSTHIKCRLDTWLVCPNSLNSLQHHKNVLYTATTLQYIWKEIVNNMARWKVLESKTKPSDCVFFLVGLC